MAIIRGFQPFDESSILSTRSRHKLSSIKKKQAFKPAFSDLGDMNCRGHSKVYIYMTEVNEKSSKYFKII